ncbi:MAG: hypothetical protein JNK66_03810 [Chitinophagales bacterium]|nr:hypothetical protein [Chitinophagales bacterium]
MSGISFVSDEKGNTTAVMIDLKKHRKIWEDFYDKLVIEQRRSEPRVKWSSAKKILNKQLEK